MPGTRPHKAGHDESIVEIVSRAGLSLIPDRAPERHSVAKAYVAQPGVFHQRLYLSSGHANLQPRAEAIERVGAHRIIAAPAIRAERPIGNLAAQPLSDPRSSRQRPVSASCQKFGNNPFHT